MGIIPQLQEQTYEAGAGISTDWVDLRKSKRFPALGGWQDPQAAKIISIQGSMFSHHFLTF